MHLYVIGTPNGRARFLSALTDQKGQNGLSSTMRSLEDYAERSLFKFWIGYNPYESTRPEDGHLLLIEAISADKITTENLATAYGLIFTGLNRESIEHVLAKSPSERSFQVWHHQTSMIDLLNNLVEKKSMTLDELSTMPDEVTSTDLRELALGVNDGMSWFGVFGKLLPSVRSGAGRIETSAPARTMLDELNQSLQQEVVAPTELSDLANRP